MSKLVVAALRSGRDVEFILSHHEDRGQALETWKEEGLDVLYATTIQIPVSLGDTAAAVLRALASTPQGIEAIDHLLGGAVEVYQKIQEGGSS